MAAALSCMSLLNASCSNRFGKIFHDLGKAFASVYEITARFSTVFVDVIESRCKGIS